MFDDIPQRLADAVGDLPSSWRIGANRYLVAAAYTIAEYLHQNPTGAAAEPFFDFKLKPDGSMSYEYAVRVLQIGETLFLLRKQPGFLEFQRRFKGRDFRSTFFELVAARTFLRGGFEIHAKPETGVKRDDFDFMVVKPSLSINVEVTSLTAPAFSTKTVRNALDTKRKQLPSDAPAIIFCVHPESWFSVNPNLVYFTLMHTAFDFFSSTKRINAVVFASEQHWDAAGDGSLGGLFVVLSTWVNSSARHRIGPLDFLLRLPDRRRLNNVKIDRLHSEPVIIRSEFHDWVDAMFATQPESHIDRSAADGSTADDLTAPRLSD
jgi:hypothetical protein